MMRVFCPGCGTGYGVTPVVKSSHMFNSDISVRFEDIEIKHSCPA